MTDTLEDDTGVSAVDLIDQRTSLRDSGDTLGIQLQYYNLPRRQDSRLINTGKTLVVLLASNFARASLRPPSGDANLSFFCSETFGSRFQSPSQILSREGRMLETIRTLLLEKKHFGQATAADLAQLNQLQQDSVSRLHAELEPQLEYLRKVLKHR